MPKHPEKRGIMTCTRRNIAYAAAFMAIWIAALALATALLHPAITGSLSTASASMRLALEALSLASVAVPTALFARLRPTAPAGAPRAGPSRPRGSGRPSASFGSAARSGRTGSRATFLSARRPRWPTSPSGSQRVSPTPPSRSCSSAATPSTPCANRSASWRSPTTTRTFSHAPSASARHSRQESWASRGVPGRWSSSSRSVSPLRSS